MKRILLLACVIVLSILVLSACSGGPSLSADKTDVKTGEAINVTWKAPGSYAKNAWIGIIPASIPHGSEAENDKHDLTYQYLGGKTSGVFTFSAPKKKGSYDFRMHDTDSGGKEVASVTFTVK
ncbi:MAG: hypothetical protein P9L99_19700 [Candidatus Lernaella stagnicola]|nr:hypothetical protein [Candidatus Lernaella stagnicola]